MILPLPRSFMCIKTALVHKKQLLRLHEMTSSHVSAVISSSLPPFAMEALLTHVEERAGEIVNSIDTTLDLSLDERNVLEEAIKEYFE